MTIRNRLVLLLIAVTPFALGTAQAFGAQPAKGTYIGDHKRILAQGSCAIPQGATWTAYFYYPGPTKAGAQTRLEYNVPTGDALLQTSTYPTTPAAGAASWSGTLTETVYPAGTSTTKSFSINMTYVDSKSWLWDRTVVAGTCTATDKIVLARTGA